MFSFIVCARNLSFLFQISEAFKPLVGSGTTKSDSSYIYSFFTRDNDNCNNSPINEDTADRDFFALQYALFISIFIQVRKLFSLCGQTYKALPFVR